MVYLFCLRSTTNSLLVSALVPMSLLEPPPGWSGSVQGCRASPPISPVGLQSVNFSPARGENLLLGEGQARIIAFIANFVCLFYTQVGLGLT